MQKEQQLAREIHEVEHEELSPCALQKIERIKALTGLTTDEVKAISASRGVDSSFALSAFPPRTVH